MLFQHAHQMSVQGPQLRTSFEAVQIRKGVTKQNEAVMVLFKCVQ